jgi:hypothetical protein
MKGYVMNPNVIASLQRYAWCLLIVSALVFCSFSHAVATGEGGIPAMSTEVIVASVRGNNMEDFEKTASDVHIERQRLCRELVGILQNTKSSNFQKCSAAYFLGEMRMQSAASVLAAHLTLRTETSDRLVKRLPVMKNYPAVEALIKIGKASTKPMIQNLEGSSDSLIRDLSARVIRDVEGSDLARIIIQKAVSKQSDSEKKKRLQAALSLKHLTATE